MAKDLLLLYCATSLDQLFIQNLLLTLEIFIHQLAQLKFCWVAVVGVVTLLIEITKLEQEKLFPRLVIMAPSVFK